MKKYFYVRESVGTKTFFLMVILNMIISISLFGYQLAEEAPLHPWLVLATYASSAQAVVFLFFAIRRKKKPSD